MTDGAEPQFVRAKTEAGAPLRFRWKSTDAICFRWTAPDIFPHPKSTVRHVSAIPAGSKNSLNPEENASEHSLCFVKFTGD